VDVKTKTPLGPRYPSINQNSKREKVEIVENGVEKILKSTRHHVVGG